MGESVGVGFDFGGIIKILGIDPGSQITGYGAIEVRSQAPFHINHGVIRATASWPLLKRISFIGSGISEILDSFAPDVVVVEKIFLGKSVQSAFSLGQMRGILLYEAGRREIDVFEYSPKTVKKGVAGSGGADKGTVKRWVEITLGIKSDQLLDATDALALALNHAQEVLIHQKMKQGLRSEL